MSALAPQQQIFITARRLTELEVTREISRVVASSREDEITLEAIGSLALKVSGVKGIYVKKIVETNSYFRNAALWNATANKSVGSAVAALATNGQQWGELRIYFDLKSDSLESPLRFVRFLAQQIEGVLNKSNLEYQGEQFRKQIQTLRSIVARRKAIHRAKALVANTRNISDREALRTMCSLSRESGKTLHQIAEAFIFSDELKWQGGQRYRPRQVRPIRFASSRNYWNRY